MMADLRADRQELATFIDALFKYADEGTFASLRAFDQFDSTLPASMIRPVKINGDLSRLVDEAASSAERMANEPRPIVFAPPICTFSSPDRARLADLANGLTLSVEIDEGDTSAARRKLEGLLGSCTIVVASGGEWTDPLTGEVFPKLHLHWRLSEPTRADSDHAKLRQARDLAARLVGADPTGKPVVHPLRWPGSWNRKSGDVLARIVAFSDAAEVHLEEALAAVEEAVETAGLASVDMPISGTPQANPSVVAAAMAEIPNHGTDVHYDFWIKLGYAVYRATGGTGFAIWDEWSAKSNKYDGPETEAAWKRIAKAIDGSVAPRTIGAGTVFFHARQAGWRRNEPPPTPNDPGYWESLSAMSAGEWQELEQRESGTSIPASQEAVAKAGPDILWTIVDPWDETAIPLRPWIARGYLMRRSVTVLSGPGSAGKSSLMVAWASALAIGCAFHRMRAAEPMRVATYNVEDDEEEQKRRFSAMLHALGLGQEAFGRRLAIIGPARVGTLLHTARDGSLLVNTPVMNKLEQFVEEFRPDVLILDPFVELHAAEENDNTAVRAVMARFRAMAIDYNMAVVILHHARKGAGAPGDPDSLRGASSIVGAARVALTMNVMTEEEAEAFGINKDDRRDYFRLDGAKNNYAPIEEAEWFERKEKILRNGNGGTGDGVAVAWPWKPRTVLSQHSPADLNAALDQIHEGPGHGVLYTATRRGAANDRWAGQILVQALGMTEAQAALTIGTWLRNGVLVKTTYRDPGRREDRTGVTVDHAKRPS